jgi:hypothetical protein
MYVHWWASNKRSSFPGANPPTSKFTKKIQRQLDRLLNVEEHIFVYTTHWATRGVVQFYSAGVVNRG